MTTAEITAKPASALGHFQLWEAIEARMAELIGDSIPTFARFTPITYCDELDRRQKNLLFAQQLAAEAKRLGYVTDLQGVPYETWLRQAELVLQAVEMVELPINEPGRPEKEQR